MTLRYAMRSALLAAAALSCVLVSAHAQSARPDQMSPPELFAAYERQGESILVNAFPSNARFEAFRASFRGGLLSTWETGKREPRHALFMLDVAIVALSRGYVYWLDYISLGSTYLRGRQDLPGANAQWDQFELTWHKTAYALLAGRRRPDHLMMYGVNPLGQRIRPEPGAPEDPPMLIDPWIVIARGFAEDAATIDQPALLETLGPGILRFYDEAMKYESTRMEGAVRGSWMLVRLKRPADAVARLEQIGVRHLESGVRPQPAPDPVLQYWAELILGRGLEGLGKPAEARVAYERALTIAPTAPAPVIAMMAIDVRENRREEAGNRAASVRTAADPVADPWWIFGHGDLRFFQARLRALRDMVSK